jgi:hypothetical protein
MEPPHLLSSVRAKKFAALGFDPDDITTHKPLNAFRDLFAATLALRIGNASGDPVASFSGPVIAPVGTFTVIAVSVHTTITPFLPLRRRCGT